MQTTYPEKTGALVRTLRDSSLCPRCEGRLVRAGFCDVCSADLRGAEGNAIWSASLRAATALEERQSLVDALPSAPSEVSARSDFASGQRASGPAAAEPASLPASAGGGLAARVEPVPERPVSASGFSVQSLLAIAGAGLFACAAVVFTFLNPDLTDPLLRGGVVAVIAAVFGLGARMLGRVGLALSAEVVGGLGVILWGLDIASTAGALTGGAAWWVAFGAAVGISSAALLILSIRTRLRTWLWSGSVGLVLTPALVSYADGTALGVTLGHLASMLVAMLVLVWLTRQAGHFESPLAADRGAVTGLQVAAAVASFIGALLAGAPFEDTGMGTGAVLLALLTVLAVVATRGGLAAWWSAVAGCSAVCAIIALAWILLGSHSEWALAYVPAAALAALGALLRIGWRKPVDGEVLVLAAASTLFLGAVPSVVSAIGTAMGPLLDMAGILGPYGGDYLLEEGTYLAGGSDIAGVLGGVVGAASASVGAFLLSGRAVTESTPPWRVFRAFGFWVALVPLLGLVGWGVWPVLVGVVLAMAVVAGAAGLASATATSTLSRSGRAAVITGAHLAIVSAAMISWRDGAVSAVLLGLPVLAGVAVAARTVPSNVRPLHTAVGYGYGLILVAAAFGLSELGSVAVLSLTVSVGAVLALVATRAARLATRHWYAVLIVTALPFLGAVGSVLVERTGWTALSTSLILALAVTLVVTRRSGLAVPIRVFAAAILVPGTAVVAVSLGAWLLESSGSPVVLPVVAVIVAAVLGSLRVVRDALDARLGLDPATRAARGWISDPTTAIEASALVTAAITVILALVLDAAGLSTALLVLVLVGVGGCLARLLSGRRYGWWVAGAAWTAALWTAWAIMGVTAAEPYYLPTALAVAFVGTFGVLRGRATGALVVSGLATAVVPTVVLLATVGEGYPVPARTAGLLVCAVALGALVVRGSSRGTGRNRGRVIDLVAVIAAIAATAGIVRAVRWGLDLDSTPAGVHLMTAVVAFSAISVALLVVFGRVVVSSPSTGGLRGIAEARCAYVPALLSAALGPMTAIRGEWASIWTLWVLTLVLLTVFVVSAVRGLDRVTRLPHPWVLFTVAWGVAVAGWSARELRVEWFSLPLGAAVLLAGLIAFVRCSQAPAAVEGGAPAIAHWPTRFTGSRWLLGPGIVLTLLPSVFATGTDPQTWRAILVIALALAAILIGSSLRLAAPFLLGLIVLPIENVVVFAVQIGRNIGALPWWITLATAGVVLLALAINAERRTAKAGESGARTRELR